MSKESDKALVKAAVDGDVDSFTELCRRYYPVMVAIAHSILADRHLAEDAAQQTFAQAAIKMPQLKNENKFANWLAVICRNESRNMARLENSRRTNDELSSLAAKSDKDNSCEFVKEALNKLSAPAREIIYLRFYDGLSYEQISSVLGISGQAINGRLRRAKRKLADYLKREGFNEFRL